jgi:WD40 repeat protein
METMEVRTPEILWHGPTKPEAVYSVDMHKNNLLATAGINDSSPANGCVRLWKVDTKKSSNPVFFTEFADHSSVVNVVRFSPSGLMLATASDRLIVVYKGFIFLYFHFII